MKKKSKNYDSILMILKNENNTKLIQITCVALCGLLMKKSMTYMKNGESAKLFLFLYHRKLAPLLEGLFSASAAYG